MTQLAKDQRVLLNGQYGTVKSIVRCGFRDRLVFVRLDGGMTVHMRECDLEVIEGYRPWPHLATSGGVDVRETMPSECTP